MSQISIYSHCASECRKKRGKVCVKIVRYNVGQHVIISKEKAKFDKSAEQNFSTEFFRSIKVIHRTPRPVYEMEDLIRKFIDGLFYEELTPARNKDFERWIPASDIHKN